MLVKGGRHEMNNGDAREGTLLHERHVTGPDVIAKCVYKSVCNTCLALFKP